MHWNVVPGSKHSSAGEAPQASWLAPISCASPIMHPGDRGSPGVHTLPGMCSRAGRFARRLRRWHSWLVSSSSLTRREGQRPRTTSTNPHTQLDQQPTDSFVREELARRVFALPGVIEQPSGISVPGARALVLAAGEPSVPLRRS